VGYLALLFIVVPAVELALLVELGGHIGGLGTLALIVTTGVVGASLAKRAGLDVLRRIQAETQRGHLPTEALMDGAIILAAGILLVTPGILTDAVGFACLVPGVRRLMKAGVRRYLAHAVTRVQVVPPGPWGGPPPGGPIIDVTPPSPTSDRQPEHRTP
jgi:UPF0716 protein FxsA